MAYNVRLCVVYCECICMKWYFTASMLIYLWSVVFQMARQCVQAGVARVDSVYECLLHNKPVVQVRND